MNWNRSPYPPRRSSGSAPEYGPPVVKSTSGMRTSMGTQTTIKFIECLRNLRCLWDTKSDEYQDRNLKAQELERLAYQFNTTSDEISKKIRTLRTQFWREHSKIKKMMDNPGPSTSKKNTWFGYEHLTFLLENDGEKIQEELGDDNAFDGLFRYHQIEPNEPYCNLQTYNDDSTGPIDDRKRVKTEDSELGNIANGQEDSFDHFGKYVTSLLRALPQHKAQQLQSNIIAMILRSSHSDYL